MSEEDLARELYKRLVRLVNETAVTPHGAVVAATMLLESVHKSVKPSEPFSVFLQYLSDHNARVEAQADTTLVIKP